MNEPVTDRELLRLAALAAEYDVVWNDTWKCFEHRKQINTTNPPTLAGQRHVWVPREDDGDAMRLALKLRISIDMDDCCAWRRDHRGLVQEFWGGDFDPSYRDAVVRAAAEIWRRLATNPDSEKP